jgi:hypothetical protein
MSDMSKSLNKGFRLCLKRWRAKTTIEEVEVNILRAKWLVAYKSGMKLVVNPNVCAGHANRVEVVNNIKVKETIKKFYQTASPDATIHETNRSSHSSYSVDHRLAKSRSPNIVSNPILETCMQNAEQVTSIKAVTLPITNTSCDHKSIACTCRTNVAENQNVRGPSRRDYIETIIFLNDGLSPFVLF